MAYLISKRIVASVGTTIIVPGTLFTWGNVANGQLGTNDAVTRSSPTQVGGDTWTFGVGFNGVQNTNGASAAGIKADGTLWTWGDNANGQLGLDDVVTRSSPTQIGGLWKSISVGNAHMTGIKTDGTMWTWGLNSNGQLGIGVITNRSSPVQVAGAWKVVAGGYRCTFGIQADGTLWAWGVNNVGQLGDGTTIAKSTPSLVNGGFSDWVTISNSGLGSTPVSHSLGVRAGGGLYAWGSNGAGQLGDPTLSTGAAGQRSAPVLISSGWKSAMAAADGTNGRSSAIKTDNTLWLWGENGQGFLGVGDQISRSSPTQVAGGGTWTHGEANGIGVKTNGTLWTWGPNSASAPTLGINSAATLFRSSPIQVGAETNWIRATAAGNFRLAMRSA